MSDAMTQSQVDAMIRDFLPNVLPSDKTNTPICPSCKVPTKRMVFASNFPIKIKIVSDGQGVMMSGKVRANDIFCFGCGAFFDIVDRTPNTRNQAI